MEERVPDGVVDEDGVDDEEERGLWIWVAFEAVGEEDTVRSRDDRFDGGPTAALVGRKCGCTLVSGGEGLCGKVGKRGEVARSWAEGEVVTVRSTDLACDNGVEDLCAPGCTGGMLEFRACV